MSRIVVPLRPLRAKSFFPAFSKVSRAEIDPVDASELDVRLVLVLDFCILVRVNQMIENFNHLIEVKYAMT